MFQLLERQILCVDDEYKSQCRAVVSPSVVITRHGQTGLTDQLRRLVSIKNIGATISETSLTWTQQVTTVSILTFMNIREELQLDSLWFRICS